MDQAFLQKLIEQGFVVGGIAIAIVILFVVWKLISDQNKVYNDMFSKQFESNVSLTRDVTSALASSANSNDKLANVLDKNIDAIRELPTRDEVNSLEGRMAKEHELTRLKIDSIIKSIKEK